MINKNKAISSSNNQEIIYNLRHNKILQWDNFNIVSNNHSNSNNNNNRNRKYNKIKLDNKTSNNYKIFNQVVVKMVNNKLITQVIILNSKVHK